MAISAYLPPRSLRKAEVARKPAPLLVRSGPRTSGLRRRDESRDPGRKSRKKPLDSAA